MKRIITISLTLLLALSMNAQGQPQGQQSPQRFSPEVFQAQFEEYITREAHLTPQEATAFFPIYREMQEKQRAIFDRQRNLARVKPADEQGCLKVIKERDEIDLELKRIQQAYHLRFLEQLSASRVYDILQAEERFYRHMMRSWGRGPRPGGRFGQPHVQQ